MHGGRKRAVDQSWSNASVNIVYIHIICIHTYTIHKIIFFGEDELAEYWKDAGMRKSSDNYLMDGIGKINEHIY